MPRLTTIYPCLNQIIDEILFLLGNIAQQSVRFQYLTAQAGRSGNRHTQCSRRSDQAFIILPVSSYKNLIQVHVRMRLSVHAVSIAQCIFSALGSCLLTDNGLCRLWL